ncbi:MAG: sialidase family protein [Thermoguttaceae bacterium]|nr:sialidase family protein [Thermoguttaceae bacterium]
MPHERSSFTSRFCFSLQCAFTLVMCSLLAPSARAGEPIPAFTGHTPSVSREITIPTVDISGEAGRHVVVARGTEETYQGHADTLLMPDGKTMFAAWSIGHAQHIGPLKRSDDGGLNWGELIDVPEDWWTTSNTPTVHRLVAPEGTERLFVFGGGLNWLGGHGGKPPYPMQQAVSEDGGRTWSAMAPNGVEGEVPPKDIFSFDGGKKLVMWSDLPGYVVDSVSHNGGLTWEQERKILRVPGRWAQPAILRSPDGKQLVMLMRENNRRFNSLYSTSDDEGRTWAEPRELPAALTGDRHVLRYAPDGRVVVVMRDRAGQGSDDWESPTYGHFVAWVGTYADIVEGREGQYRVKLLHSHAGADCGYAGFEVLPDGTLVATTYVKYQPGPERHSVVSVRFKLDELDRKLAEQ